MSAVDLLAEKQAIALEEANLVARKENIAAQELAALQAKHAELLPRCRAARDQYERLVDTTEQLQRQEFRLRGDVENAERQVSNARASMPRANSYPTALEMKRWEATVSKAQEVLAAANKVHAEVVRRMEINRLERMTAKAEFDRIADEEAELRSRIQPALPGSDSRAIISTVGGATIIRSNSDY